MIKEEWWRNSSKAKLRTKEEYSKLDSYVRPRCQRVYVFDANEYDEYQSVERLSNYENLLEWYRRIVNYFDEKIKLDKLCNK